MSSPGPRLFFDYVDPLSWMVELRLAEVEEEVGREMARHPYELVTPPSSMLDAAGATWRDRWERAEEVASEFGTDLVPPDVVPWSRKAHELALHAREEGVGYEVHHLLFRAFLVEGRDVGRVDVLVELAERAGLDPTAAKAVLDVDRHLGPVRELREAAERLGVPGVPSLLAEGRFLQGVPDREALRAALLSQTSDHSTRS